MSVLQSSQLKSDDDGLDQGILPELVGYSLRRAQLAIFADFAQATEAFELSPGQFGLLTLIEANPGITAAVLAREINLDKSSLTPLITRLEQRGLIERTLSPTDKRSRNIEMTRFGRGVLLKMTEAVRAHEDRLIQRLGKADTQRLLALLRRTEEAFTERR